MKITGQKLIAAWQLASEDLGIEIETNYEVNTEEGKGSYPVFIKNFGRTRGTIVARHELFMELSIPKNKDYFFSAINARSV